MSTLETARTYLFAQLDEGAVCPCCDQYARRYRRKLNSGMARWLIALVTAHARRPGWVHVRDLSGSGMATGSADFAKLRYWGLIEERENDDDGKRSSGYWQPTAAGILFASGKTSVRSRVILYNGVCEGFEGERITIREALGDKWDYRELMGWVGSPAGNPAMEGFD